MSRLEKIQAMLAKSPNDSFLHFALAKEYEQLGQEEQAGNTYAELLQKDSSYVGLYYHYGKWFERANKAADAATIYQQGIVQAQAAADLHARGELQQALDFLDFD